MPSTGSSAMDTACGQWGASKCTAERWYEYLGDIKNNPFVPFQMNYKTGAAPPKLTSLELDTKSCNESYAVIFCAIVIRKCFYWAAI